jgi:dihydrodipicolinate synthase/N-acetylneuraminate lyase
VPDSPANPAPPEGLIIDLVTPLTAAGDLDDDSLARLVERVLPVADGLLAGGPLMGEALGLPPALRRELLLQTLAAVRGRCPVLWGITGHTSEETREWALTLEQETRRLDYPGPLYLADLPLWYHSNRGLPQAYEDLLAQVSHPLIVLNLPEALRAQAPLFKRRNIRTHVFKRLAGLPRIAGLIYRGEMRRFLHYHHAAAHRTGFAFYEADEVNFLTRPGSWGVVSAGAQLLPRAWQRVTRACLHPEETADEPGQAYELWNLSHRLQELSRLYQHGPVALVKAALAAQGVIDRDTTAPGTPPAEATTVERLTALLGF